MKQINKLFKLSTAIVCAVVGLISCESMLEVDSERIDFPGNQDQNNIYSMIGIFSELEELAVPYVLMGELRADLMETTENADADLQEIYQNNVRSDNPYNVKSDYYSVINQCNYLINNIDTSLVESAEKIYMREYAAAKAIRAWTYMQLTLNYGEAKYIEQPLLNVSDADADFPVYTMEDLIPVLISDLEAYPAVEHPESIDLGADVKSEMLYFPIALLLGDLYMWSGHYELAMNYYYIHIYNNRISVPSYSNKWEVENGEFTEYSFTSWRDIFDLGGDYQITSLAYSLESGKVDVLDQLFTVDVALYASPVAIDNWESQAYYGDENLVKLGDLRGERSSYYSEEIVDLYPSIDEPFISKFINMQTEDEDATAIAVNRMTLLYLRYAECVNRSGRPNFALAMLKHGVDEDIFEADTIIPHHELYFDPSDSTSEIIYYLDFSFLTNQTAIHDHGCGESEYNTDLTIPALPTLQDSIEFVEDLIVKELALETAFEGNRFHDLMRVAKRRNDTDYLASRVGAKYDDGGAMREQLKSEANWYLK